MMIVVPVVPHVPPPPPQPAPQNMGCDYQVKVNSETWRCLTQAQYQEQREAERIEIEAKALWLKDHWLWFVVPVVLFLLYAWWHDSR